MDNRAFEFSKGLGKFPQESYSIGWKVGAEDVSLPVAVVNLERVKHNVNWMKRFTEAYGLQLCPHVKTTMCPKLIELQMKAGAWGVTTATVHQTSVLHALGVSKRVLMANLLVGKRNLEIISEILKKDSQFEFLPIVDSVRAVELLHEFFGAKGQKLDVLVEIGIPERGRTGVRNQEELEGVIEALRKTNGCIRPRGIEFYEGLFTEDEDVRGLCRRAISAAKFLTSSLNSKDTEIIISGAGSNKFDVVAEELSSAKSDFLADGWKSPLILLRPGCYVVHDIGVYQDAEDRYQKLNPIAKTLGKFKPALQVIANVLSVPEPNLAIIGLGKRDIAIDCGFPVATLKLRPSGTKDPKIWTKCPTEWAVTNVMDQHVFLKTTATFTDLQVGDMIAFDISHPCNTFSAWKQVLAVDDSFTVSDIFLTYF